MLRLIAGAAIAAIAAIAAAGCTVGSPAPAANGDTELAKSIAEDLLREFPAQIERRLDIRVQPDLIYCTEENSLHFDCTVTLLEPAGPGVVRALLGDVVQELEIIGVAVDCEADGSSCQWRIKPKATAGTATGG